MALATSTLLTLGVFLMTIVYVIGRYLRKIRLYDESVKCPGPPTLPFIGNAQIFLGSTEDVLNNIQNLMDTYPSPSRFWLADRLCYIVYKPEQIQAVLKTVEKTEFYKFVEPCTGAGLISAPVAKWRAHRKLIMPTFHLRILESFVEIFSLQSQVMVKKMKNQLDGGEFDIFHYVSACSIDMICETAIGVSLNAQTQRNMPLIESIQGVLEIISKRMFKFWLHPDIIFYNTRLGKKQCEYVKCIESFMKDVIKRKKQAFAGNGGVEGANKKLPQNERKRKAFLDLLMELNLEKNNFSDKDLRDEVNTMIIGAFETTATAESFVLLALATHSEIQDKAYKELCEIYGTEDPSSMRVKHEDLHRMVYLERIIKETLRIFPTLSIISRFLTEDLNIGDCTLMKGSSVFVGIIKTHRSEEYWAEPLTFNPDRFLPEECAKRHPYAYIPFGAGSRNCIGLTYAMMSIKTALATIIYNYVIKKDNVVPLRDIKLKFDIALKTVEPITIKIERRIHRKH